MTSLTGSFHENLSTFMIIYRSIRLRMKFFFGKTIIGKVATYILRGIFFSLPENGAFYEIMWENMVETFRQQMAL